MDGDVETGSIMAGQSVGMVKREEPAAEIVATLMRECEGRAPAVRVTTVG